MIVKYTLTEAEIKAAILEHLENAFISDEIDRDTAIVRIVRDLDTGVFTAEVVEVRS